MKTLVRFCLGTSVAFEAIVTLCIFFSLIPSGMLAARLAPWAVPLGILTVGTIVTFVVVGKSWERMGRAEKVLVVIPAIGPLGVFKFMFIVIAFFVAAVVILAVIAFILSSGGGTGEIIGSSHNRASNGNVYDRHGNRIGLVEGSTGVVKDKYGNRVGSVEPNNGIVKDRHGNRIGSVD